jgi:predicted metal-dependent hydrolase
MDVNPEDAAEQLEEAITEEVTRKLDKATQRYLEDMSEIVRSHDLEPFMAQLLMASYQQQMQMITAKEEDLLEFFDTLQEMVEAGVENGNIKPKRNTEEIEEYFDEKYGDE